MQCDSYSYSTVRKALKLLRCEWNNYNTLTNYSINTTLLIEEGVNIGTFAVNYIRTKYAKKRKNDIKRCRLRKRG